MTLQPALCLQGTTLMAIVGQSSFSVFVYAERVDRVLREYKSSTLRNEATLLYHHLAEHEWDPCDGIAGSKGRFLV